VCCALCADRRSRSPPHHAHLRHLLRSNLTLCFPTPRPLSSALVLLPARLRLSTMVETRNGRPSPRRPVGRSFVRSQFILSPEDKRPSFSEEPSDVIMTQHAAYCDDYCGASSDAVVSSEAREELHVASTYNFDHAGHVTASTRRLLDGLFARYEDEDVSSLASIHCQSRFAVAFSALVHDDDHQGVPNAQLVTDTNPLEDHHSLECSHGRSIPRAVVADIRRRRSSRSSWSTRRWTPTSPAKSGRRCGSCGGRGPSAGRGGDPVDARPRSLGATNVLEQFVQASDVAHTMQQWETFTTWNERLYQELSKGHREGRGASERNADEEAGRVRRVRARGERVLRIHVGESASMGGRGRGSYRSDGARRQCVRRRDDPSPKRGGVRVRERTDGIELAPPMRCLLKTRSCARALFGIGAAGNGVGLEKNNPAGGDRVPQNKSGGHRRTAKPAVDRGRHGQ
jgi:hypothetical protein